MNEQEIIAAITNAPDGKLNEQEIFSGASPTVARRYTNMLAKLRKQQVVKRVIEGENRFYIMLEGGE